MKKIISIKNYYLIVFFISLISLLSAVYIENILGVVACKLCLYQRIPYLLSIFICFFGFNYYKNYSWIYLLIVVFLLSLVLSSYHVGIENNIFPEFSGCTGDNINSTNKSEILSTFDNNLPNCKDISFKIIGLSLATINLIISLLIVVISILFIKNEKNR